MTWDKLLRLAKRYECARVEYENDPHGGESYAGYLFAASVLARAFVEFAKTVERTKFPTGDVLAVKRPTPPPRPSRNRRKTK